MAERRFAQAEGWQLMTSGRGSRPWIRRFLQVALTVAVTWLVVNRVGVTLDEAFSIQPAVPNPSTPLLVSSVAILLSGFIASAWLWGHMALELGDRAPGLISATRIVFSANLGRYLPGKIWQIAGLAVLSGRGGMSRTVAGTAGVLGQAFALAAVGVLGAPVLMGAGRSGLEVGVAVLAALVLFVVLASIPGVLGSFLSLAFRIARMSLEQQPELGRLFGLRWLGWYLLNWTIYGIAFVLFVHGLGFSVGGLTLVSSFAAAYLLGYLAVFAPAGLGVREGFLIVFLRPDLAGAAVGVALLTRLWMTTVELLPAGGFALWEIVRTRQRHEIGSRSEKL